MYNEPSIFLFISVCEHKSINYDDYNTNVNVLYDDDNDGLVNAESALLSADNPEQKFLPDEDTKKKYVFQVEFRRYEEIPELVGLDLIVEPEDESVDRRVMLQPLDEDGLPVGDRQVRLGVICFNMQ